MPSVVGAKFNPALLAGTDVGLSDQMSAGYKGRGSEHTFGAEVEEWVVNRETGAIIPPHHEDSSASSISQLMAKVVAWPGCSATAWTLDGQTPVGVHTPLGDRTREAGAQLEGVSPAVTDVRTLYESLLRSENMLRAVNDDLGLVSVPAGVWPYLPEDIFKLPTTLVTDRYRVFNQSTFQNHAFRSWSHCTAAYQTTATVSPHAASLAEAMRVAILVEIMSSTLCVNSPERDVLSGRRVRYKNMARSGYMRNGTGSFWFNPQDLSDDKIAERYFASMLDMRLVLWPVPDEEGFERIFLAPPRLTLRDVIGQKDVRELPQFQAVVDDPRFADLFAALQRQKDIYHHASATVGLGEQMRTLLKGVVAPKSVRDSQGNVVGAIERRLTDSVDLSYAMAHAALVKAQFDPVFYAAVAKVANKCVPGQIDTLYDSTIVQGVQAQFRGKPLTDHIAGLLELAAAALGDDACFLAPFEDVLRTGRTPAHDLKDILVAAEGNPQEFLKRWEGRRAVLQRFRPAVTPVDGRGGSVPALAS